MAYFTRDAHYFDCNATTPISPGVVESLPRLLSAWGNPSSIHWAGREPKNILRDTRKKISASIGVSPLEIVFTSGGTEGNNAVIRSAFEWGQRVGRDHFICSTVEHPSVIKAMKHLQVLGAKVDFIPINLEGRLDLEFLKKVISSRTALVSVMYANNETGTIFPIEKVAEIAKSHGALVHTDAVQALGKIDFNLGVLAVDYATFSAHKFYALKGTGFLYIKKTAPFVPLLDGGAQERYRRGGTENIIGIGALGVVADDLKKVSEKSEKIKELRDHFEKRVISEVSGVQITAAHADRLSNTSSLVIHGVDGETLLMSLDIKGYAVSTGAACSSGNPEPSPVLLAMGLSREEAQSSLRVSLGWQHTEDEVNDFVEILKLVISRLRNLQNEQNNNLEKVVQVLG